MGVAALDNRLLQYNAKSHFLNALLCYMAMGDEVAVKQKLEHYKASDYTFADARECKFVEKLVLVRQPTHPPTHPPMHYSSFKPSSPPLSTHLPTHAQNKRLGKSKTRTTIPTIVLNTTPFPPLIRGKPLSW